MPELRPRTVRALILCLCFLGVLAVFMFRLFQLQVLQGEEWSERSERNHKSKRIIEMKRGSIYDRNGAELALSVENYTVFLYTKEIKSMKETANILSTILPMTREEILQKVAGRKGYIPIFKNLERGQANKVKALNLPGISLEETYKRVYPQNRLASNLLGFCGTDGHGLEGLELSYDTTMRGYPGIAVQEDVSFTDEPPQKRVLKAPAGGSNMYLTIDSFIQHLLESELAKLVEQYKPIDATAIVLDPFTGEVLGMACLPNYDLNEFADSTPDSHRNRSVVDVFEPGSCMKIFAAAAALKYHRVGPDTRFYCRGYQELWGKRIRCHGSHALVDLPKAIAESCNAAMIQISQLLDARQLYRMYRELGFGDPTGLEVPAESQGMFSPPSRWSGLSAGSMCIGQEIAVTGIQLVQAYAAIANGGYLIKPRLVKRIVSQAKDIDEETPVEKKRQVFSPAIADQLRHLLFGVVEDGTGKLAAIPDYTISGKTSTAQKANPRGGYFQEKVVTSFIGLAPALNPRVVLLVAVNEPKGDEKTLMGGKVAAPTFAIIADRILKYLKIPPDRRQQTALLASGTVATDSPHLNQSDILAPLEYTSKPYTVSPFPEIMPATSTVVPDFSGLTLKQVANMVRKLDLPVQIEGNGIVVGQNPRAGVSLAKVGVLTVKLSP